ncbi:hypothetical protein [Streptomyces sp. DSM 40750]|nr:hypothetical protein [Streptomyces sp. DSM 40750]UUU25535.1 hypothetical protein JIX55_37745 [Streptomyces sp. DSM 40750]
MSPSSTTNPGSPNIVFSEETREVHRDGTPIRLTAKREIDKGGAHR